MNAENITKVEKLGKKDFEPFLTGDIDGDGDVDIDDFFPDGPDTRPLSLEERVARLEGAFEQLRVLVASKEFRTSSRKIKQDMLVHLFHTIGAGRRE